MKRNELFGRGDTVTITQNSMPLVKKQGVLNKSDLIHLLRRLSFNPTPEIVSRYVGRNIDTVVNELLGDGLDYLPQNENRLPEGYPTLTFLDNYITHPKRTGTTELQSQMEGIHKDRYSKVIDWWIDLMKDDLTAPNIPSREKLTLFWATVWNVEFTYDTDEFIPPPLLYRNNQKLRKNRLGNYKNMALDMTLDGAFLLYQSLNQSTAANPNSPPNENYMRELLELFTMGIANPDDEIPLYTEGEIRIGARVLTGWRTPAHLSDPTPNGPFETYFSPKDHDTNSKTLFGVTITKRSSDENTEDKVREEEVQFLINALFNRRPDAIAKFICDKIYRYFVYSNPSDSNNTFINDLAEIFKNNNFDILPVFKALFTSEEFYDIKYRGVQIKTPPEVFIGLEKLLNVRTTKTQDVLTQTEQTLYDPPNVSGWTGYRSWISTNTFPIRYWTCVDIINLSTSQDILSIINSATNTQDLNNVLNEVAEYFFPKELEQERLNFYLGFLNEKFNINNSNWKQFLQAQPNQAATAFKELFKVFVKSPDFQLT